MEDKKQVNKMANAFHRVKYSILVHQKIIRGKHSAMPRFVDKTTGVKKMKYISSISGLKTFITVGF